MFTSIKWDEQSKLLTSFRDNLIRQSPVPGKQQTDQITFLAEGTRRQQDPYLDSGAMSMHSTALPTMGGDPAQPCILPFPADRPCRAPGLG